MSERANIILSCLKGMKSSDIAHELGLRPNTVGGWRKRFVAKEGIEGLRDKPRSGKPVKYGDSGNGWLCNTHITED